MVVYILTETKGRDDQEVFQERQVVIDRLDKILSEYCEENGVEDRLETIDLPSPSLMNQRSDYENSAVAIAMMEKADIVYVVTNDQSCPMMFEHSIPYNIAWSFTCLKCLRVIIGYSSDAWIKDAISAIKKGENNNA